MTRQHEEALERSGLRDHSPNHLAAGIGHKELVAALMPSDEVVPRLALGIVRKRVEAGRKDVLVCEERSFPVHLIQPVTLIGPHWAYIDLACHGIILAPASRHGENMVVPSTGHAGLRYSAEAAVLPTASPSPRSVPGEAKAGQTAYRRGGLVNRQSCPQGADGCGRVSGPRSRYA